METILIVIVYLWNIHGTSRRLECNQEQELFVNETKATCDFHFTAVTSRPVSQSFCDDWYFEKCFTPENK
jgi:hypothetical protein